MGKPPMKLKYEFRYVKGAGGVPGGCRGESQGMPVSPGRDSQQLDFAASMFQRSLVRFEERIGLATAECERIKRRQRWLFVEIGLFLAAAVLATARLLS